MWRQSKQNRGLLIVDPGALLHMIARSRVSTGIENGVSYVLDVKIRRVHKCSAVVRCAFAHTCSEWPKINRELCVFSTQAIEKQLCMIHHSR